MLQHSEAKRLCFWTGLWQPASTFLHWGQVLHPHDMAELFWEKSGGV